MTDAQTEIPLSGGRVTAGVVRVGDTVRKPVTENSGFVRSLLEHLASNGSDFSPDFLRVDESERDVLTFIDGDVPEDLAYFDEKTLRAAAILIRKFHDLSAELVTTDAASSIEVACHNDLSPCNFVFRGEMPVAIIDFDAAAPGSRAYDLGYAAWLWLDMGSLKIDVSDQQRRFAAFLEAYGAMGPEPVLESMLERQGLLIEEGRANGDDSLSAWANSCRNWTRQNLETLQNT
jgi:tRNA A-37 threonylcarbamoyl transferase component Bud32